LGRIVNAYLELAEDRARRKIPMSMEDCSKRLDAFLEFDEREVLKNSGKISAKSLPRHMRKVNLRSTELCKIACLKAISTKQ